MRALIPNEKILPDPEPPARQFRPALKAAALLTVELASIGRMAVTAVITELDDDVLLDQQVFNRLDVVRIGQDEQPAIRMLFRDEPGDFIGKDNHPPGHRAFNARDKVLPA